MDKTKLNLICEVAAEKHPDVWKACYPRQIVPPPNYLNPRHYSADLFSHVLYWHDERLRDIPHVTENLVVQHIVHEGVPTYFIAEELAVAVNRTRLPEEFALTDIKWPREAMLFVLPDSFIKKEPFKCYTPFVAVCRAAARTFPIRRFGFGREPYPMQNTVERLCGHYPLFYDNDLPSDLSFNLPTTRSHKDLTDIPFTNVVPMEAAMLGISERTDLTTLGKLTTDEAEKEHCHLLDLFIIKLLFVLTACPKLVKDQEIERPEKVKKGKVVQKALWKANVIGTEFKLSREGNGSHASPCTHIRWGHLRQQPHGPGSSLRKLIWIEPTLVNASK